MFGGKRYGFLILFIVFILSCVGIAFFSCEALNFEGLEDEPEKNGEPAGVEETETPPDKDANFFLYPPAMFKTATLNYTDGSVRGGISVHSSSKISSFAVPKEDHEKTIYSISLYPSGGVILLGRNAGETISLEFNQDKKLVFRTNQQGSLLNPIPIGSYEELMLLKAAFDVEATPNPPVYLQAAFLQEADIDLFGDIFYSLKGMRVFWTPIGKITPEGNPERPFNGIYDGGGKKLYNLTISSGEKNQGFFAAIGDAGVVKNISLKFASLEAGNNSGLICAFNYGTIENCGVSGISKRAWVQEAGVSSAGICGTNKGSIIASYFIGNVDGVERLGGVCGVNNGEVQASFHYGSITGSGDDNCHITMDNSIGTVSSSFWYDPYGGVQDTNETGDQFGASSWPVLTEIDPQEAWSTYKKYGDDEEKGRWKTAGSPSDTPANSNLPKLWFD
ncbi:MAG: hypothetical protein LBC53_06985 [Spirochaetaceae bacterium]|jgi:hypothetical protein|nr:hypothetical protein [Spirochaetaceae bacterium]